MHSKSENVEIIINDKEYGVIEELDLLKNIKLDSKNQ